MARRTVRWWVNTNKENKCDVCCETATHLLNIDQPKTNKSASYVGTYPRCKSHGVPKI